VDAGTNVLFTINPANGAFSDVTLIDPMQQPSAIEEA
jgi:hypothetical protein